MTSFTDIFGALAVLPILLIQGVHPFQFELQPIWGQMLYMCIGNTGIVFYLYFKALESLDTSVGAMSFLLKPFIASIIAAIFLGEAISFQLVIGILFVSFGTYLVLLSARRKQETKIIRNKLADVYL